VLAGSSIRDLDARMEASLLGKNVSLSRSKGLPKTLRFLVGDNADIEIP
jgi:glucose-1-phosphate thymidylyltransferase